MCVSEPPAQQVAMSLLFLLAEQVAFDLEMNETLSGISLFSESSFFPKLSSHEIRDSTGMEASFLCLRAKAI